VDKTIAVQDVQSLQHAPRYKLHLWSGKPFSARGLKEIVFEISENDGGGFFYLIKERPYISGLRLETPQDIELIFETEVSNTLEDDVIIILVARIRTGR
jgi:hypothetical protein